MGLGSEMKNLSEELLASFKQRIKENEELVNEVQNPLTVSAKTIWKWLQL